MLKQDVGSKMFLLPAVEMCLIIPPAVSSCQSSCSVMYSGIVAFWKICFNKFYIVVNIIVVSIHCYVIKKILVSGLTE